MATGVTNPNNMMPEVPAQMATDWLSTPLFNLINSFGADMHYMQSNVSGPNFVMSRLNPLNTEGGQLDGSGIDPAPEVPVRADVTATMEFFAKCIVVNEQVNESACYLVAA